MVCDELNQASSQVLNTLDLCQLFCLLPLPKSGNQQSLYVTAERLGEPDPVPGPKTKMGLVQRYASFHVELWEIFYWRETDRGTQIKLSKGAYIYNNGISRGASPHSVDFKPSQTLFHSLLLPGEFESITPLQNTASCNMIG